jgi:hypothetical protein
LNQGQNARKCKRRYCRKLNGMEETVRLCIHTGTECHCTEFVNKANILTREATLVLASKIHETGKAYLWSQTPDAFGESDVGTVVGAENWISEGFDIILDLNLIPSCRNDFDSLSYQTEPWTVFNFSINLDTLTIMTSRTHFSWKFKQHDGTGSDQAILSIFQNSKVRPPSQNHSINR